jgi:hypothetical protein
MPTAYARSAFPYPTSISSGSATYYRVRHLAGMGYKLADMHSYTPSSTRNVLDSMVSLTGITGSPTTNCATASVSPSLHRRYADVHWSAPRHPQQLFQQFRDAQPIAVAKMAAALFALIWIGQRCYRATAITPATDSTIVYYTLSTGKGTIFRWSALLQQLYVTWFLIKMDRGHGLVLRWVPSNANLADPVPRGVLA